ncbi:hypothetical protein JHK86_009780 [Glycine max]|nr:hypothetical protein JHK86_009780 [Glycine max]
MYKHTHFQSLSLNRESDLPQRNHPPFSLAASANHLRPPFLPPCHLTPTLSLSSEDQEVLVYLISCSSSSFSNNKFSNSHRQNPKLLGPLELLSQPLNIHKIIDTFKDSLAHATKPSRKYKRNKSGSKTKPFELTCFEFPSLCRNWCQRVAVAELVPIGLRLVKAVMVLTIRRKGQ